MTPRRTLGAPPRHVATLRRPAQGGDAYRELREAIVSGRFQPNQRLVEAELTSLFHAGRTSIRSALIRLDQEGLVTREQNRGARVRLISDREAIETEQVRIVLERFLARSAAERITSGDLSALEGTAQAMRERLEHGDALGYSELNARFHQRIWETADHQVASKLLASLKSQSIRFQYRTMLRPGRAEASMQEHEAILGALIAHDANACDAAMADHLRHVVETLRWAIETQHRQPPWSAH
jgi:DNA-binding GntR family transcriptional regulator